MHRSFLRAVFAVVVVAAAAFLGAQYASYAAAGTASTLQRQASLPPGERTPIAGPRDGVTVISGQGQGGASRFEGQLAAVGPDGRLLYYNDSLGSYFDVDPSPAGRTTVMYVGSTPAPGECVAPFEQFCQRNVVERVNLTTGEVTRLYSAVTRYGKWHDVDRLDDTHLLIADIGMNQVFVVDTTTGLTTWRWQAKNDFPLSGGGRYPADWTHLNDVEALPDGRTMVSLRNQDQVVFLDRKTGLVRNWTLGSDNAHGTLYEQHNPDYIPPSEGGPAVVVADSENNRVVEYQRRNGAWNRTWQWSRPSTHWPRDADRLPNGHTLVTVSNGDRVVEVDRRGDVVWNVSFRGPYEAERLGTGDESAGGPSAARANLTSRTAATDRGANRHRDSPLRQFWIGVKGVLPSTLLNVLIFVRPAWLSNVGLTVLAALAGTLVLWGALEAWWSPFGLRSPIRRKND